MPDHTPISPDLRFLCLVIDSRRYLIELSKVRHIFPNDALHLEPGADGAIGTVSWHHQIVPVFPLADRLWKTRPGPAPTGPVIVFNLRSRLWAALVERTLGVITAHPSHIFPVPRSVRRYLSGIEQVVDHVGPNHELIPVISPERLNPLADDFDDFDAKGGNSGILRSLRRPTGGRSKQTAKRGIFVFSTAGSETSHPPVRFGVSLAQVCEILAPQSVVVIPGLPPPLAGLVIWRNQPIPVTDLSSGFGLPAPPARRSAKLLVVIAPRSQEPVGVLMGSEATIHSLPVSACPVAGKFPGKSSFQRGIFEHSDGVLIVPDFDRLLFP